MNPNDKFKLLDPMVTGEKQAALTPCVEATALGLQRYQVLGRKGVLSIVLTQAKNPETQREEPALLLANVRDPKSRHAFVLLSQLHQCVDAGAAREVVIAAKTLAPRLFGFVTKFDVDLVCDVLLEFADDLRCAPPSRKLGTQQWLGALAEDGFEIRHDGKRVN